MTTGITTVTVIGKATVIVRRWCNDSLRHSVNEGDATNPVLLPGRETDNESNSKSNRDRDSYTLRSDFKSDRDTDSNNVNDSENNSVNNSDVTNSVSVSSGGKRDHETNTNS